MLSMQNRMQAQVTRKPSGSDIIIHALPPVSLLACTARPSPAHPQSGHPARSAGCASWQNRCLHVTVAWSQQGSGQAGIRQTAFQRIHHSPTSARHHCTATLHSIISHIQHPSYQHRPRTFRGGQQAGHHMAELAREVGGEVVEGGRHAPPHARQQQQQVAQGRQVVALQLHGWERRGRGKSA